MINRAGYKKMERFFKDSLKAIHVKRPLYRSIILPSQMIALRKLRKIHDNTSCQMVEPVDTKIVFNSLNARHMYLTYVESMMAKALQLRGYKVKMLLCGGILSMCTGHHTIDTPFEQWSCDDCINFSEHFFETIGLDYSTYWDYFGFVTDKLRNLPAVQDIDIEDYKTFKYKGVNVGFHAMTSAERYFKGDIDNKKQYNEIFREELLNAIVSTEVAEGINKTEKPDIFVTSHGCYSAWGSILEYFNNAGVATRYYMPGETDTITFDTHRYDEYFKKYANLHRELTQEEKDELWAFIGRRTSGTEGQTILYEFENKSKQKLNETYRFDDYRKTYVLFPNVPWDAALLDANVGFKDMFDWLSTSIDNMEETPDKQLLIKVHPSEVLVMQSKKTVLDYINKNYKKLPSNVKLIPPTTDISPYSLFPCMDAGFVYNGTVGIEMALNGIPVVVSGKAHYSGKGFTIDVKSKKKYEDILSQNIRRISSQKEMAEKYAYFYFIKTYIPNPFVYEKSFMNLGWNISSFDEFRPGKNKYLDHVCNYIVNNGIFQDW